MPKNALFLLKNRKNRQAPLSPDLQPPAASPPDPHWPPAAGGSTPIPPDQPPPNGEILAKRLIECILYHIHFPRSAMISINSQFLVVLLFITLIFL